jgi:hypothetical protein
MRLLSRSVAVLATTTVIVGGGAYALASVSGDTITVCISSHGGTLYKARKCSKLDKKLTWNQQGPSGSRGPQGPTGSAGAQGLQGVQGPQGIQGPVGPSNAYFGDSITGTASVSVPAGDYAIYGQGGFSSNGSNGEGACYLEVNGNALSASAANSGWTVQVTPAAGAQVANEGVGHLTSSGTIANACMPSGGAVVGTQAVMAIKVGSASP